MTFSRSCKLECIDRGYEFCLDKTTPTTGYCCEDEAGCAEHRNHICSFEQEYTSGVGFDYWACPFDQQFCGTDSQLVLAADGSRVTLQSSGGDFLANSLCRYEVELPATGVAEYDQIMVFAREVTHARIYIAIGESYTTADMAEITLQEGEGVLIRTPNKAFLTVISVEQDLTATFTIETGMLKRAESTLTDKDKKQEI